MSKGLLSADQADDSGEVAFRAAGFDDVLAP